MTPDKRSLGVLGVLGVLRTLGVIADFFVAGGSTLEACRPRFLFVIIQ
jgi:hypothetical protein